MLPTNGIQNRPAAAPAPAPAPATAATSSSAFAQLLLGQATPEPPAAAKPPEPARPPEATPPPRGKRATAGGDKSRPPTEAAKPAAPARKAQEAPPSDKAEPKADAQAASDDKAPDTSDTTEAAPTTDPKHAAVPDADPALGEFTQLLGLSPTALGPTPVAAATADASTETVDATAPTLAPATGRHRMTALATGTSDAPADTQASPESTRAAPAYGRDAGHTTARPATALVQTQSTAKAESATASATPARIAEAAGPTLAQTLAISGRGSEAQAQPLMGFDAQAAAAVAAQNAAAAGSPSLAAPTGGAVPSSRIQAHYQSTAFAPEVAARVSVLAADGVQRAELQLNPADMGPVTVDIVVNGQQAHVSFEAAQADTRQALERSLPDLAAALRDGGLTLAGGGVFQQSSRQGGEADPSPSQRSASAPREHQPDAIDLATAALSRPPGPTPQGLLDTFA